jgi:hypothetical protein
LIEDDSFFDFRPHLLPEQPGLQVILEDKNYVVIL